MDYKSMMVSFQGILTRAASRYKARVSEVKPLDNYKSGAKAWVTSAAASTKPSCRMNKASFSTSASSYPRRMLSHTGLRGAQNQHGFPRGYRHHPEAQPGQCYL